MSAVCSLVKAIRKRFNSETLAPAVRRHSFDLSSHLRSSSHSHNGSSRSRSPITKRRRLGKDVPLNSNTGIFRCAVCQVDQPPSEGLSVNSGPFFSPASKPWEGPFLCTNCRKKKDAMEGKRSSTPALHNLVTWCEAMSTYPRTYDFIHGDSVFSLYKDRCEIEDILLEMPSHS